MNELKTTGKLTFDADGDEVELLEEDLLIDMPHRCRVMFPRQSTRHDRCPGYQSDTGTG